MILIEGDVFNLIWKGKNGFQLPATRFRRTEIAGKKYGKNIAPTGWQDIVTEPFYQPDFEDF
jgi:hypothetical protein